MARPLSRESASSPRHGSRSARASAASPAEGHASRPSRVAQAKNCRQSTPLVAPCSLVARASASGPRIAMLHSSALSSFDSRRRAAEKSASSAAPGANAPRARNSSRAAPTSVSAWTAFKRAGTTPTAPAIPATRAAAARVSARGSAKASAQRACSAGPTLPSRSSATVPGDSGPGFDSARVNTGASATSRMRALTDHFLRVGTTTMESGILGASREDSTISSIATRPC